MATITYQFIVGQVIWHITDDCGIKQATVIVVEAEVITSTTLTYTLQYTGEDTTVKVVGEDNLYADLVSGGSPETGALAAYGDELEA